MTRFTESEVEEVALEILSDLGYSTLHGPDITPDGRTPERNAYSDVILVERLRDAIDRFNPASTTTISTRWR
jgi:type I restriction enzyme R subunit